MITRSKANAILADMFGGTIYIGLSTDTPNENGGNFAEPIPGDITGYKRAKVEVMAKHSSIDGQVQNTDIIFFPECLSAWGTITHFGVFTAQTGGTPFFWGESTPSVPITAEYIPIFRKYALMIGLDKDALEIPAT